MGLSALRVSLRYYLARKNSMDTSQETATVHIKNAKYEVG